MSKVIKGGMVCTADRTWKADVLVEGEVIKRADVPLITEQQVRAALSPFEGKIRQVPPVYSAIKYKGRPLSAPSFQVLEHCPANRNRTTVARPQHSRIRR